MSRYWKEFRLYRREIKWRDSFFPYCLIHQLNYMRTIFKYSELTFWVASLTLLALMPPGTDAHFSFCVFKLLGIDFCPGCGLGHSISYLFHGNLRASFSSHPLGLFAVIIILSRIYKLLQFHFFSKKTTTYATRL